MRRIAPQPLIVGLLLLLPFVIAGALIAGTVAVPLQDLWGSIAGSTAAEGYNRSGAILWDIRLPRILLALLVGVILASSGAVMQGLFRNPLADPSLIGVSSGASVGASVVIVLLSAALPAGAAPSLSLVACGAFAGGVLATLLVYRLATSEIGTSVATMLLAGIAITALAGALNSLLSYFADNDMLRRISLWQMGNLSGAGWNRVWLVAIAAIVATVLFPRDSRALNALLLGESEARHLGIDVDRVKYRLILVTALAVGVSVAAAGLIAFVGLVVPHTVRLLIGPDHRWLIPASALCGGLLLVIADSLARVIISPAELPTGILTALLGAPFFLLLLIGQRRSL